MTFPQTVKRTPFDRYKIDAPHPPPEPDPNYHVIQCKLGLSKEAFENEVNRDIDDLLRKIEATRRQELLDNAPFERVLSKEDYLRMFQTIGVPTTGPLFGIYRWAAELGTARFNFGIEFDKESLYALDAYD